MRDRPGADNDRGQLSLSVVEAGVGVLFVLAVVAGFGLDVPDTDRRQAQLDAYAADAAAVLAEDPPRHGSTTRVAEVAASPKRFERERAALAHRVDRILPDNLLFRVVTPHGAVGHERPTTAATSSATIRTRHGEVVIWIWYA